MRSNQLISSLQWKNELINSIKKNHAWVESFRKAQKTTLNIFSDIPQTHKDLIAYDDMIQKPYQHKSNTPLPERNINPRQKRKHDLKNLINETFAQTPNKPHTYYWNLYKKLSKGNHDIIKHVEPLSKNKTEKITWESHTGKTRSVGRRRFANMISQLTTNYKKFHS